MEDLRLFCAGNRILQNLDLSWNSVKPSTFQRLLETLSQSQNLLSLNLSWNALIEPTPVAGEFESDEFYQDQESAFNSETLKYLVCLVKSQTLKHLILEGTRLTES